MALEAVTATRTVLESTSTFDPERTVREFTVASSEYGQVILAPALLGAMSRIAPGVRLRFQHPAVRGPAKPADLLEGVDGWLAPREVLSGYPSTGLVADRWVCVASLDNPHIGTELSLADVEALSWVAPTVPGLRLLPQLERLLAHGIEPTIEVTTESFSAVPFLVAGTSRLGLVQEGLGARLAGAAGVRLLECPWTMPPLNLTLWWHPDQESDLAHAWFRGLVATCMDTMSSREGRAPAEPRREVAPAGRRTARADRSFHRDCLEPACAARHGTR